jgi:hypothetical protein
MPESVFTPYGWIEEPLEYFRKPDKVQKSPHWFNAVWYGPGGETGEHATLVALSERDFLFTEYRWVDGLVDDRAPEAGGAYLMLEFDMDAGDARKLILRAIAEHNEGLAPAERLRVPHGPGAVARIFASIGAAYVAYHTVEEDTAVSLP